MRTSTVYIVTTTRRGAAALIAMMYLMIFATMAVGFYATTNTNAIVATNEMQSALALGSAESGMDFMRYQLSSIVLPYGTTPANLLTNAANVLGSQLNDTPNMAGSTVTVANNAINIPSATGWITLDRSNKSRFRATITQIPGTATLVITVRGGTANTTTTRGIRLQYKAASRSQVLVGIGGVTMSSNAYTDSYNSSKGAYNAATAGKNGSIASNGDIILSNTAKVNGDARPGPARQLTLKDSSNVTGSRLPLAAGLTYPSVVLPAAGVTNLGDVTMSSGTQSMPGGTYLIRNLNLSGTANITWTGPVVLYIQNSYVVKDNVVINTYQNNPKNRAINFLPTCTTASWSGSNTCVGDLYAPDTNFTVSGSVHKFGRIIAKTINNSSSGGMHADDALPQPGGMDSYQPDFTTYEEVQ